HPAIQEVTVMARTETNGQQRLVAYVVENATEVRPTPDALNGYSENSPAVGTALWRTFLQEQLPEYMIPSAFVVLEQFPLTPNGKLDRKALPAPDSLHLARSSEFTPPQGETEKILARVWEEVLGLERIGRYDNFFELGGDSIISLQVVSRAQA
ncbi:MAG: hypothetical protein KDE53_13485, partial [Caldilineaceae bacterium]|nr:hypothetical protein [Caldilineaceae bacterium]